MALAGTGAGMALEAQVSERIKVAGVMTIVPSGRTPGSIGLDDGRCFDLALPETVCEQRWRRQSKREVVSGPLMSWPKGLVAGLMWIDIKDRKVEGVGSLTILRHPILMRT
ncbi:hypothetical protein ACI703_10280 [Isoptericola jiangsuensis]|uniref:hypothetical protein n=1 Tax=Isoptericola jiangsuensis TaxID=548579 RepID=UPI0038660AAA